jgi:biotin/methionine sulfoxide reductase
MLLGPGTTYRYNGQTRTYPGHPPCLLGGGNPFHHHQDLNACGGPSLVSIRCCAERLDNDRAARSSYPCTMTLEREDIGGSSHDPPS